MKSFREPLSPAETEVMLAFSNKSSIAYPADCIGTKSDIAEALVSLKEKGFVKNKAPYKLTNKGKVLLKELLSSNS